MIFRPRNFAITKATPFQKIVAGLLIILILGTGASAAYNIYMHRGVKAEIVEKILPAKKIDAMRVEHDGRVFIVIEVEGEQP